MYIYNICIGMKNNYYYYYYYYICLPSRRARVRIPGGAVALWASAIFTLWSLFTQELNWGVHVSLRWEQPWTKKTTGGIT